MFKKFTETLSGTLDTVKSYGTSMVAGQAGQDGNTDRGPASKLSVNAPTLGNGTVSAPATTANSPDRAGQKTSMATNTLINLQNTIGKITGRGDSTNAAVMASHQSRDGRGPVLGSAVATNETRITAKHVIDDDLRGLAAEDISGFEQYKKFKSVGYLDGVDYNALPTSETMNGNGAPKLFRSDADEIADQQFKSTIGNLDDVINVTEQLDELTPVTSKKDDEDEEAKKPKKKKNKHIARCIRCIQDNRVKGGCVDPEEMADAAEDNAVLKKVLNIVFLVIGTLLFLAVFVVIIYTSIVKEKKTEDAEGSLSTDTASNMTYAYEYIDSELDSSQTDWYDEVVGQENKENKEWLVRTKAYLDTMSLPEEEG